MSFDHLKTSFLDRWGGDDRPRRQHGPPARSYTMPPQSTADSGSESESSAPTLPPPSVAASAATAAAPGLSTALMHPGVQPLLPPAAPTPPNEPAAMAEFQETKTQISINAEHGAGQIVLSISENKQKRRKKPHELDHGADSRPGSPARMSPLHQHSLPHQAHNHSYLQQQQQQQQQQQPPQRAIEAGPPPPPAHTAPVQVIEADPEPVAVRAMELHSPQPHSHSQTHSSAPGSPDMAGRMEMYKPAPPEFSPPTPPVESETPAAPPLRPRLLEGKVCAITGASRGIGRAIAIGFAREGAHIIAHYWGTKSDPANEEIVSLCVDIRSLGQGCTIVFGDVSDPRTSENIVRRAVETYGRLDVAVGNAGMCWYRDFLEVTPELLRRHVDVNLNGNFYFVQACARQFKRQFLELPADTPKAEHPDYAVICVSAAPAADAGAKQAHFSPTAAGIRELMRSCAQGLARFGVRCNTLAPGIVQTKMVKDVVEDMEVRGRLEKKNPFGRLGVPGDVVGPAVWLASDMARWTNGQEIVVDGGTSIG